MRGHRRGHHRQGTQRVLELGAVEKESVRGLLAGRKDEVMRMSAGQHGPAHMTPRDAQAAGSPLDRPLRSDRALPGE